ncbi:MAG: hypothetical protein IKR92_04110 [Alphaproteobacteria bacterium]|nr:hypothetical protein [Alphaproteobacteria bacterium]
MAELINRMTISQEGVEYNLYDLPEGFVIKGGLDLGRNMYMKLPDLSKVIVEGNFDCRGCHLKSFVGAPKKVTGDFNGFGNEVTSLEGMTEIVGGNCNLSRNKLTSLEGSLRKVGNNLILDHNPQLTSLEYIPEVGGSILCEHTAVTSLAGISKADTVFCKASVAKQYFDDDRYADRGDNDLCMLSFAEVKESARFKAQNPALERKNSSQKFNLGKIGGGRDF